VEVDGLIVSRVSGVQTATLTSLNMSNTAKMTGSHGSVLSLPYSSRTQLTYNSTSSTQRSSGRSTDNETLERGQFSRPDQMMQHPYHHHHHLHEQRPQLPIEDDDDEEPPYETIPSVPPSVNITTNETFNSRSEAAFNSRSEAASHKVLSPEDIVMHQDDSVISAHDMHTGIYDIISKLPSSASADGGHASIDAVQGYFFRKKLLMQDANETRL
jgi:hypothetical protein